MPTSPGPTPKQVFQNSSAVPKELFQNFRLISKQQNSTAVLVPNEGSTLGPVIRKVLRERLTERQSEPQTVQPTEPQTERLTESQSDDCYVVQEKHGKRKRSLTPDQNHDSPIIPKELNPNILPIPKEQELSRLLIPKEEPNYLEAEIKGSLEEPESEYNVQVQPMFGNLQTPLPPGESKVPGVSGTSSKTSQESKISNSPTKAERQTSDDDAVLKYLSLFSQDSNTIGASSTLPQDVKTTCSRQEEQNPEILKILNSEDDIPKKINDTKTSGTPTQIDESSIPSVDSLKMEVESCDSEPGDPGSCDSDPCDPGSCDSDPGDLDLENTSSGSQGVSPSENKEVTTSTAIELHNDSDGITSNPATTISDPNSAHSTGQNTAALPPVVQFTSPGHFASSVVSQFPIILTPVTTLHQLVETAAQSTQLVGQPVNATSPTQIQATQPPVQKDNASNPTQTVVNVPTVDCKQTKTIVITKSTLNSGTGGKMRKFRVVRGTRATVKDLLKAKWAKSGTKPVQEKWVPRRVKTATYVREKDQRPSESKKDKPEIQEKEKVQVQSEKEKSQLQSEKEKIQLQSEKEKSQSQYTKNEFIIEKTKQIEAELAGELPKLECKICHSKYQSGWQLSRHYDRFHSNIKCKYCPLTFKDRWTMELHVVKKHPEADNPCPPLPLIRCEFLILITDLYSKFHGKLCSLNFSSCIHVQWNGNFSSVYTNS